MMESVSQRMSVQNLTERTIIRRNNYPLMSRQITAQTDVVAVSNKDRIFLLHCS